MTEPAVARVLVVTDSDSYVKWGAALAGQLPRDWSARLVITRSDAMPSDRQVRDALVGTRFEHDVVPRVGVRELQALLRDWQPDVLVAAARGYTVQATASLVPNTANRPVLVSGLAGIAVPVLPFGLGFRRAMDVFVVHSRRELREFTAAARLLGGPQGFELARLPFADRATIGSTGARRSVDRIVFAAQAQVPAARRERAWLVDRLVELARARPDLAVVVKVRARAGETQTHHESVPYEQLVADVTERPPNLLVESGPMRTQLRSAVGLVTVSSTAILEAIAADVPVLALDDFGVGAAQINAVLEGSGLLGSADDLLAGRFRHPDARWLEDNYFHGPDEDTWTLRVQELLERRRAVGLPPYRELPAGWANRLRRLLYRRVAFAGVRGRRRDDVVRRCLLVARLANRWRGEVVRARSRQDVVGWTAAGRASRRVTPTRTGWSPSSRSGSRG